MEALIEIGKNTVKYFLWIVVMIAVLLLLMVPCFIGVAIDCVPLMLLGIIFFAAAGGAIMKYHIEHNMKDE